MTRKQENEIYRAMYKHMEENEIMYYHTCKHGFSWSRGICFASAKASPIYPILQLNTLYNIFKPETDSSYWWVTPRDGTREENYQSRLFCLAMCIAMTD